MDRHVVGAIVLATSLACSSQAPEPLDCSFIPVESREDELPDCAYIDRDGQLVLRPAAIEAIQRRDADPVAALVGGTLYYVNSAGRSAPVLWYDNGADYFAEGLARSPREGKVGFVDRTLTERIAPTWDFAFPFENGFSMVCQGCRSQPVGEHREVSGGLWGYINREGTVVVPVQFEREHLPPLPGP